MLAGKISAPIVNWPYPDGMGVVNADGTPYISQAEQLFGQNYQIDSYTYGFFISSTFPVSVQQDIEDAFYRVASNEPLGVSLEDSVNLFMSVSNAPIIAAELQEDMICNVPNCNCPPGYVRVSTPLSMSPADYVPQQIIGNSTDCTGEEGSQLNGVCRRITCRCDETVLPDTVVDGSFEETGRCDDADPMGVINYYAQSIVFPDIFLGLPNYENLDPLMCNFDYLCCIDATYDKGGLWKHNDRCDLFANYYDYDYPWEVEIVESKGQTVNTVRSVEYQLESYIYKGNLNNNCGDRFHDLDWNFDEVIIHNTEQVSGLLRLDLNPKNNVPIITDYPIISANDIRILYSKEEQKDRFNQFWDITYDRGEFSGANQSIFLTELNGYIRQLNEANLNYFKPAFQHKKFRHYWNKVILRRSTDRSNDRKMILKLANTKINASFR